jgi:hypothetical protein
MYVAVDPNLIPLVEVSITIGQACTTYIPFSEPVTTSSFDDNDNDDHVTQSIHGAGAGTSRMGSGGIRGITRGYDREGMSFVRLHFRPVTD